MVIKHLLPREIMQNLYPKQREHGNCVRVCLCVCIMICCLRRWASSPAVLPNYVAVSSFFSLLMETILINYSCVWACVCGCVHLLMSLFSTFVEMRPRSCLYAFHVLIFWQMYSPLMHGDKYSSTELYLNLNTLNIFTSPWPAVQGNERCGLFRSSVPIFSVRGYMQWQSGEVKVNRTPRLLTCRWKGTHTHSDTTLTVQASAELKALTSSLVWPFDI